MKVKYKAKLAVAALLAGLWSPIWGVEAAVSPMDIVTADQVVVSSQVNTNEAAHKTTRLEAKPSSQTGKNNQLEARTNRSEAGTSRSEASANHSEDPVNRPEYMNILDEAKAQNVTNGVRPELVSKVLTTADNKALPLPKNMTVFDFKRIVTPSGMVDGISRDTGLFKNEAFQNRIRFMARPQSANLPEYMNFEGQVYRDWNAYQLQGVTKEAHHTAYAIEFALGTDFIKGQRAELALSEALFKKSLAKREALHYSSNASMEGPATVGSLGAGTDYVTEVAQMGTFAIPWEVRRQMNREATEEAVISLIDSGLKRKAAFLAPYPETYTADSFYKATVESLRNAQYINDASAANELIAVYKDTISSAIFTEVTSQIRKMEEQASLTEKERTQLLQLKRFNVGLTKFLNTSHIYFDEVNNEEVQSKTFGPMIRSISRGALYFDSYEVPFNVESLVRFAPEGPVVTTIFANDGDAKYWEKQISEIWGIQEKGRAIGTVQSKDKSMKSQNNLQSQTIALPGIDSKDMTVKKLSFTVIVPYVLERYEEDLQKSIAKGPELRHWRTNELLTGEELKASQEDYANLVKRAQQLKDYRLGEKTEVYQWQVEDKEGRKTATVLALALTPETTKHLAGMWQEALLDSQLPALNEQWLQSEGRLNKKITKLAAWGNINDYVYHEITLDKQAPIRKLTDSKVPVYTASTKVYVNLNGFELPYYLQGAVVLSKEQPTAYVLFTSDKEGHTFAEKFEDFVKAIQ